MKKKGLAVAVILLFIGMCVVPSTAVTDFKDVSTVGFDGNTLYVGGSGPNNYTKIQDAINDSNNGDTVFVYNGTYYEFVLINKQITLRGEDKNNTIIEGSGTPYIAVFHVYSAIKISNFTIRNTPDHSGFSLHSSNSTITNCILYNLHNGIYVYSDNNSIINCQFYNNFVGISINTGNNNEISYCQCYSNEYGGITINSGKNNKISNCNIYSNIGETGKGIYMDYANNNTITKCNISINQIGIWIAESDGNIEKKNNFIGNIRHVYLAQSWGNTWDENYWDNWIGLKINWTIFQKFPKVIVSILPPWINFDWNPAQEPYDIGVFDRK
jgi:parallel beta-helix repeat protein